MSAGQAVAECAGGAHVWDHCAVCGYWRDAPSDRYVVVVVHEQRVMGPFDSDREAQGLDRRQRVHAVPAGPAGTPALTAPGCTAGVVRAPGRTVSPTPPPREDAICLLSCNPITQTHKFAAFVHVSSPDRRASLGLGDCPVPGRDGDRHQPRRPAHPAQPQPARPRRLTGGGIGRPRHMKPAACSRLTPFRRVWRLLLAR